MYKTFTQNDLVRFLYGEMNTEESKMLQLRVLADKYLMDELLELQEAFDIIDLAKAEKPSRLSEMLVISYANSYSVLKLTNQCDFNDFSN